MEFIVWLAKIDPVTLFVFLFVTLFVTEGLKYLMAKVLWFCALLEIGFFKVVLSWVTAAPVFLILHLTMKTMPVTGDNVFRCFLWILLLNGGYKIYSSLREMVRGNK